MLVLLVSACTGTSTNSALGESAESSIPIEHCPVTEHHNEPLPEPFSRTIKGSTVWMGGPDALAVLFYTQGTSDLTIGTNGTNGPGMSSKILWLVDSNPKDPLTLEARNLTTGTETTQEFDGSGNYPSIPVLPDEGCWRLTVSVSGSERLSITLPAEHRTT